MIRNLMLRLALFLARRLDMVLVTQAGYDAAANHVFNLHKYVGSSGARNGSRMYKIHKRLQRSTADLAYLMLGMQVTVAAPPTTDKEG